jgi:diaminopimelate decarboxylase
MLSEFKDLIRDRNTFYLFDADKFIQNIVNFKLAFSKHDIEMNIGYSFKTNYTPKICMLAKENGCWAEVVSSMEYDLAEKLNYENEVILNGPLKEKETIVKVGKNGGIIHVDTIEEFEYVMNLALISDTCFRIALRLNVIRDELKFSRFGIHNEDLIYNIIEKSKNSQHIELVGFHVHYPNRTTDSFVTRCKILYEFVIRFHKLFDIRYLSLGGGFYSEPDLYVASMFNGDIPDFTCYADAMVIWLKEIKALLGNVKFFVEPGTALVANTMDYYSKIYSFKIVDGVGVATLWGSVFNITGNSRGVNFPFEIIKSSTQDQMFDTNMFVGYTCIESDIFNKCVETKLSLLDIIVFKNVGSYSVVFKPPFILPNCPVYMILGNDISVIKRAESFNDIFQTYTFD